MKITRFFSALLLALTVVSCHLNFEATFHDDASISMEIGMQIDERMVDEFTPDEDTPEAKMFNGLSVAELPTEWISFYDLGKTSGEPLPKDRDSIRFLKSVLVKFNTHGGKFRGFGMKISRAGEQLALVGPIFIKS